MRNEVLENKQAVVSYVQERVQASASTVLVEYRGLNVGQITELRRKLTAEGIEFKVLKNSYMQRAVEGTEFEGLKESMTGPNAVAFSDDAVAPARILAEFAKKNKKLVLKAGIVDGQVVNTEELTELSKLPNHDGMIAMLLGMFQSPIRSFAYAVSQVAEQRAAGEPAPVAEAEEATPEVAEETVVEETTEEAVEEAAPEVAEEA